MSKIFIILTLILCFYTSLIFSQNVAIELERMNVFYKSIENPFKVVAQYYPCEKLILKSKYGIISPASDSCHYFYRTDSCKEYKEYIYVGVKLKTKIKWIDTLEYRLKNIPDPTIYIANISTWGIIDRDKLIAASGLYAGFENFDYDLNVEVLQYSVVIYRNDSVIFKAESIIGKKFSEELISEIRKSKTNDRYIFDDVVIKTFNKCSPKLSGPEIKIK